MDFRHLADSRRRTPGRSENQNSTHLWKWADIYDGLAMEYVNPLTGGSTLPTLSCWIQLLKAGQRTQSHRHTSTVLYHAFRGRGTTVIDGQEFHWEQGDNFVVPLWHWHEHANTSASDEAILFSMNDAPVLKPFGLYREETRRSQLGL